MTVDIDVALRWIDSGGFVILSHARDSDYTWFVVETRELLVAMLRQGATRCKQLGRVGDIAIITHSIWIALDSTFSSSALVDNRRMTCRPDRSTFRRSIAVMEYR
jgi:hypothetical protein